MPIDNHATRGRRDTGGMVMAVVFIALAAVSLWDTTTMTDADSYVFPRAIAVAMIVFSMALIVCRETPASLASFSWDQFRSARNSRSLFFIGVSSFLKAY